MHAARDGDGIPNAATEALHTRLSQHIREFLHAQFTLLDDALCHDMEGKYEDMAIGQRSTLEPIGLEELQAKSTEMFRTTIGRKAPGAFTAVASGILGFLIFWTIFLMASSFSVRVV